MRQRPGLTSAQQTRPCAYRPGGFESNELGEQIDGPYAGGGNGRRSVHRAGQLESAHDAGIVTELRRNNHGLPFGPV